MVGQPWPVNSSLGREALQGSCPFSPQAGAETPATKIKAEKEQIKKFGKIFDTWNCVNSR